MGPGPHPNGTPQTVHGRADALSDRPVRPVSDHPTLPGDWPERLSAQEVVAQRYPEPFDALTLYDPDNLDASVYEQWVMLQPSRDIRQAALEVIGDDGLSGDPHSRRRATWGGTDQLSQEEAHFMAEYMMGSLYENYLAGLTGDPLYRALQTTGLEGDEAAFWNEISVGEQFDVPLMATLNMHPIQGSQNILDRFGSNVLIEVVSAAPGLYGDAQFAAPFYMESDENQFLDQLIEIDREMGSHEPGWLETVVQKFREERSFYRLNQVTLAAENYGLETKFWGDAIPESSEEYYEWYDWGDTPQEVVTGGRFEVVSVQEGWEHSIQSKSYDKVVRVRQVGVFDPFNNGELVTK